MPLNSTRAQQLIDSLRRVVEREEELEKKDNSGYWPEEVTQWRLIVNAAKKELTP